MPSTITTPCLCLWRSRLYRRVSTGAKHRDQPQGCSGARGCDKQLTSNALLPHLQEKFLRQIKAASPSCNQSPDPYQQEPRAVGSSSIKDALCGGTVPTVPAQTWTQHLHQPSRSNSWCWQQTQQLPGKGVQGFWKESVIESVNIVYAVFVISTLKV